MQIAPAVREALIAAGGCVHVLEPQKGCDTCGRPPAPWASAERQVLHYDFGAQDADGHRYERKDAISIARLPLDKIAKLWVKTDDPRIPLVRMSVDPRKGERLFMFTRSCARLSVRTPEDGSPLTPPRPGFKVLVLEVVKDPSRPKDFVRLYLHPTMGPILSTEDLSF